MANERARVDALLDELSRAYARIREMEADLASMGLVLLERPDCTHVLPVPSLEDAANVARWTEGVSRPACGGVCEGGCLVCDGWPQ